MVGTFLLGCAVLLLVLGCSGTSSETSDKKEQGSSPQATASEEARCDKTGTTKNPSVGSGGGAYTTNDLPGCPNGGLLLGTDTKDRLAGKDGDDEIRALGAGDLIFGGLGNDVIYAGPGDDFLDQGDFRDEGDDVIYGGSGDEYVEPGKGADVIYGGDGSDYIFALPDGLPDGQRDKLYCGKGMDK
jgi:Ca2+-binding RTX toxin-like protein